MAITHFAASTVRVAHISFVGLCALAAAGCQKAPIPRTFSDFCTPELDGERVAVEGYLALSNITICGDDIWGNPRCPLIFVRESGQSGYVYDLHRLYIYLGSDKNRMRMPSNSDVAELVVFDNHGQRIDPLQRVLVTGKLSLSDRDVRGNGCSINVDSIATVASRVR